MCFGFSGGSVVKNPPADEATKGDAGSIPGSGRYPGGRNSNPLQYFCQDNPWTEEPGGLPPTGSQTAGHNLATEHACTQVSLQCLLCTLCASKSMTYLSYQPCEVETTALTIVHGKLTLYCFFPKKGDPLFPMVQEIWEIIACLVWKKKESTQDPQKGRMPELGETLMMPVVLTVMM